MLKLGKIAIVGGILAGKSSACKIMHSQGSYVISADDIVHKIYLEDITLKEQIVNLLGNGVLTNNQLDRKKIAKIVFLNSFFGFGCFFVYFVCILWS